MKGLSEESIISALKRKNMSPGLRKDLEEELDWIRRGRPKDELTPDWFGERCAVELGGPIPARFKHLQHLNNDHPDYMKKHNQ